LPGKKGFHNFFSDPIEPNGLFPFISSNYINTIQEWSYVPQGK